MYAMLKPGYAENNSGKTFRGIYLYTVRGRKEKNKGDDRSWNSRFKKKFLTAV